MKERSLTRKAFEVIVGYYTGREETKYYNDYRNLVKEDIKDPKLKNKLLSELIVAKFFNIMATGGIRLIGDSVGVYELYKTFVSGDAENLVYAAISFGIARVVPRIVKTQWEIERGDLFTKVDNALAHSRKSDLEKFLEMEEKESEKEKPKDPDSILDRDGDFWKGGTNSKEQDFGYSGDWWKRSKD